MYRSVQVKVPVKQTVKLISLSVHMSIHTATCQSRICALYVTSDL